MELGICIPLCRHVSTLESDAVNIELVKNSGFSSVYFTCHEDDYERMKDTLQELIRKAKSLNLKSFLIPWGYGKVCDPNPVLESKYLSMNPDTLQINSEGKTISKCCPNNPKFVQWYLKEIRNLSVVFRPVGFFWDEPSFDFNDGIWACRCQFCLDLFKGEYGHDMPIEFSKEVRRFRQISIIKYLEKSASAVKEAGSNIQNIVMTTPSLTPEKTNKGTENWVLLLKSSYIDGIAVFACWQLFGTEMEETMSKLGRKAISIGKKFQKPSQVWITGSPEPNERLLDANKMCKQLGGEMLVIWEYGTLLTHEEFSEITLIS